MSNCKNPNCKEKDLHPVTVSDFDGCCGPLCEEIMDHEQTLEKLKQAEARLRNIENIHDIAEWDYDDGDVLLWKLPIVEPPEIGSPMDSDYEEGRYTHFSIIPEVK